MKLLLAGAWRFQIYEPACAAALTRLGRTVTEFRWAAHLDGLMGRAEEHWSVAGLASARLNRDLQARVRAERPDAVLIWRGTLVRRGTVSAIRETGAVAASYNNDDPFGPHYQKRFWRHYLSAATACDVNFVYREVNVGELEQIGARQVRVLRPYFVPELHHPIALDAEEQRQYSCDAVFVGHYENDGRIDYLRALIRAGLRVKLFGPSHWNAHLAELGWSGPAVGQRTGLDYAKALSGARMALCFLSRLNRDTYTRRCFEVPACGQLLLSERTDDLRALFREDREAVYFSTPDELVAQARRLLANPDLRDSIAAAGLARVTADGHSVDSRMRELVAMLDTAHA